jgi:hypothetical protein
MFSNFMELSKQSADEDTKASHERPIGLPLKRNPNEQTQRFNGSVQKIKYIYRDEDFLIVDKPYVIRFRCMAFPILLATYSRSCATEPKVRHADRR